MYNGNEEVERLWKSRGPLSILLKLQSGREGCIEVMGRGIMYGVVGEKNGFFRLMDKPGHIGPFEGFLRLILGVLG